MKHTIHLDIAVDMDALQTILFVPQTNMIELRLFSVYSNLFVFLKYVY